MFIDENNIFDHDSITDEDKKFIIYFTERIDI